MELSSLIQWCGIHPVVPDTWNLISGDFWGKRIQRLPLGAKGEVWDVVLSGKDEMRTLEGVGTLRCTEVIIWISEVLIGISEGFWDSASNARQEDSSLYLPLFLSLFPLILPFIPLCSSLYSPSEEFLGTSPGSGEIFGDISTVQNQGKSWEHFQSQRSGKVLGTSQGSGEISGGIFRIRRNS